MGNEGERKKNPGMKRREENMEGGEMRKRMRMRKRGKERGKG